MRPVLLLDGECMARRLLTGLIATARSTPSQSPAPHAASYSSPRPSYSTGSLPQLSSNGLPLRRAPSSSRFRHENSASEPPPPAASSARKRSHRDGDDDTDNGVKRSKLSEAYTFDDSDEDAKPMELDDAALSRGTKRREDDLEQGHSDGDSSNPKRSKTSSARSTEKPTKKRRASPSPSASGSDEEAPRQGQKKARTSARGAGSVRDKRGIEDVSFEHDDDDEVQSDAEFVRESRNADSDVSDDEGEEASESTEQTLASDSRPSGTRTQVKRFRGRADRAGTDDEDLMGDDLDADTEAMLSPPPAKTPAKKPLASATPAKKRLSSRAAASARKAASKLASSATKKAARRLSTSSSTPRKIGEEWTNYEGDRYRIDEDGQQRRLVEVRELRRKYKLPADSKHPDAKATHEVSRERSSHHCGPRTDLIT